MARWKNIVWSGAAPRRRAGIRARRRRELDWEGAVSYFRDNVLAASHNLKAGGEYLDESGNIMWEQGYADSVIHFLRDGVPNSVRMYNSGTSSQNALATTSFFVTDTWSVDRLTLNVGGRFDRYRVWLPEQTTPVSRFNPTAVTYQGNDNIVSFNHIVPRLGAIYDLQGTARRCSRPTGAASSTTRASTSPTRSTPTRATSTPTSTGPT